MMVDGAKKSILSRGTRAIPDPLHTNAMGLCSRCGKRGHNKRTCPTRNKRKAPTAGSAGDDARPAGGAKKRRATRGGGGAGLHDPYQAARAAVAGASADVAAVQQQKEQAHAKADAEYAQEEAQAEAELARAKAAAAAKRKRAKAAAAAKRKRAKAAATKVAAKADRPVQQRLADARAALAREYAKLDDPGDLPCFPAAVRNGRRFPWSIALQFAAARDLATLAATHRAARDVCRHE